MALPLDLLDPNLAQGAVYIVFACIYPKRTRRLPARLIFATGAMFLGILHIAQSDLVRHHTPFGTSVPIIDVI